MTGFSKVWLVWIIPKSNGFVKHNLKTMNMKLVHDTKKLMTTKKKSISLPAKNFLQLKSKAALDD